MNVLVAISGGVDSAVVTSLLLEEGHDVTGVHMITSENSAPAEKEAHLVAQKLGIPLHIIDMRETFEATVIGYLLKSYKNGLTPNPCAFCNRHIKFGLLWESMKSFGHFDSFATGHYAKILYSEEKDRYYLKEGPLGRDQSYFLSFLKQEQLRRTLFPLGERSKDEVRAMARERNLPVAEKKDSQDLCFGDYRAFLPPSIGKGDFVLTDGKVIGEHNGIENYTIGQRKGLGIGWSKPLYVLGFEREKNRVIVGEDDELKSNSLKLHQINSGLTSDVTELLGEPSKEGYLRIRSQGEPISCTLLSYEKGVMDIVTDINVRAITAGQVGAFYRNKALLFSGIIISPNHLTELEQYEYMEG